MSHESAHVSRQLYLILNDEVVRDLIPSANYTAPSLEQPGFARFRSESAPSKLMCEPSVRCFYTIGGYTIGVD